MSTLEHPVSARTFNSTTRAYLKAIEEYELPPHAVARGLLCAALEILFLQMNFAQVAQFSADTIQEFLLECATGVAGDGRPN